MPFRDKARQFLNQGLAPLTQKRYKSALDHWFQFRATLPPMMELWKAPIEIQRTAVVAWIRHMRVELKWGMSKINGCLAATRYHFLTQLADLDIWTDPVVQTARRAATRMIGREQLRRGSINQKFPLPLDVLLGTRNIYMNMDSVVSTTYIACCLAYHLMMRSSEFVVTSKDSPHLITMSDVEFIISDRSGHIPAVSLKSTPFTRITGVLIHIRSAKNDQQCRGFIHALTNEVESPELERQIVRDLGTYVMRYGSMIPSDPFFRRYENGRGHSVRTTEVSWLIKDMMKRVGENPNNYSSHSLRKGGASTLKSKGESDENINHWGRWKPGSRANLVYTSSLRRSGGAMSSDTVTGPLRLTRLPFSLHNVQTLHK